MPLLWGFFIMSDSKNVATKKQEEFTPTLTTSDYYAKGKQYLSDNGYLLKRNINGPHCFHKIYRLKPPAKYTGLEYPSSFKVWREITSENELALFHATIFNLKEEQPEVGKFWWAMVYPDPYKRMPIYGFTVSLIQSESLDPQLREDKPRNLLMAPIPQVPDKHTSVIECAPISFIPRTEWIKPSIRGVTFGDILTIFSEAEQQLLALIIGRICVGPDNHLPPGYDEAIRHTSRMCALVVGEDPGLGKSALMNKIFSALQILGYTQSTFSDIQATFNMGQVATCHILYKDDMTDKTLQKFVQAENTKIIITGNGQLRVQDKGIDALNIVPMAVPILNCNSLNPRIFFGMDPGAADRIKPLATIRETELKTTPLPPLSQDSPDIRPKYHIPWLAEKLNVSETALIASFLTKCRDYFLACIEDKGDHTNYLEVEVERLTLKLKKVFHKDLSSQAFSTLFFSHGLAELGSNMKLEPLATSDEWKAHDFSAFKFQKPMQRFQLTIGDRDFLMVPALLKYHYETYGQDDNLHPWFGYKFIDPQSVKQACLSMDVAQAPTPGDATIAMFEELYTREGLSLSTDRVWLTKAYERVLSKLGEIGLIIIWLNQVLCGLKRSDIIRNINADSDVTINYRQGFFETMPDITPYLSEIEKHEFPPTI